VSKERGKKKKEGLSPLLNAPFYFEREGLNPP